LSSLLKDYETYKKNRNVTFIGINTSITANLKTMESQVKQFNLKPFANMLDAGGATAAAYNIPKNAPFWLVVIDGGGKIAYNASRGWTWSGGADSGKFIHQTQLEKSLKEYPEGILGAKEVPKDMETAAHYYDLQQFDLLEGELRKFEGKSSAPACREFAEHVRARIAESRKARKEQIEALSRTEPVQAYREATSFAAAFPTAPERTAVNDLGRELLKAPEVKKEIQAEAAFQQMLVPELKKTTTLDRFLKNVQPLLDGYLKSFGATQYGAAVKIACEAHKLKVSSAK
jgi:hypothetical protein